MMSCVGGLRILMWKPMNERAKWKQSAREPERNIKHNYEYWALYIVHDAINTVLLCIEQKMQ